MQYMLFTYLDPSSWNLAPAEQAKEKAAYMAFMEALNEAGVIRGNKGLAPPSAATTVRVVDGKSQVVDGPFADSKEQIGGFFLIEVPDLDAAIQWAARCPAASRGGVEIRPAWG